jgi:CBS domain containing-hemolysin-like protein
MLGAAFFSGIETGVISIHPIRLRHLLEEGVPGARTLQWFRDHSDRLLGTTLTGTNICIVIASIVAAETSSKLFPTWGKAISSAVVTTMLVIFSEYMPKAWFRSKPLDRSRRFAKVLRVSYLVLRPVAATVTWFTYWIVPRSSYDSKPRRPFVTREDLKALAHELDEGGVISSRERVMIHRVFELSSKTASQIMVPRDKMVVVGADASAAELVTLARKSGLARFPVYDAGKDIYTGIVNVLQVPSVFAADGAVKIADHVRPAPLINADMPVDQILPRLRRKKQPMCLVTDAQSRVIGSITTEDVLEEIVGKL